MNDKKFKRIVIILLAALLGLVLILGIALSVFLYSIKSTKNNCSNYAIEQSKTSTLPEDVRYSAAYDQCLRDNNLGGF